MIGKTIGGGWHLEYTAKGLLSEGIVFKQWTDIWSSEISRAYTADFKFYDEKAAFASEQAEIKIYIATKK